MTLVLSIGNVDSLSNGGPLQLELERRGAVLGRSPTVEWTLPDAANYISSRHCEIRFENGVYFLRDTSTNGTLVNGLALVSQHRLTTGDLITIGQYEISVTAPGQADSVPGQPIPDWGGWNSVAGRVGDPAAGLDWGRPLPKAPISGDGFAGRSWAAPDLAAQTPPSPQSGNISPELGPWNPPHPIAPASPNTFDSPQAALDPVNSTWGQPEPGHDWLPSANSLWSSPVAPQPPSPSANDIWGRLADVHGVELAGLLVNAPAALVASDALALSTDGAIAGLGELPPRRAVGVGPPSAELQGPQPFVAFDAPAAPPLPTAPEAVQVATGLRAQLASLLGLAQGDLAQNEDATLKALCGVVRALVSGLVVMVEARAKAKSQLGAQTTILQFDGNNPLKFARSPAQALAQLLNEPMRGFMPADRAIEDAFLDLQAHQIATLRAMQGALAAVLDRFSPTAIDARTEATGLLSQILPGARDAALWRAYSNEFSGVNEGSDEVFMEVFAREFRRAYEDESMRQRAQSPRN